jgi:hypothetical protein
MKYIKLFEDFDMEKIMSISKEAPSPENQKISDRLLQMFGTEPLYGTTYAKNLKHIPYEYSGDPEDILTTFDLDLKKFDSRAASQHLNSTSWSNLSRGSFNDMKSLGKRLFFEYSINIFIKENGEIIFRFNSVDEKGLDGKGVDMKSLISEEQLKESYTKDFKNSEEMFDFIESQNLTELLSQETYQYEIDEYVRKIDTIQRKQEDHDSYMSRAREGY